MMNIFRGDIFYVSSGASCYDMKEGRPAIIVSNNMCNTYSDRVEVVFLTTKEKKPMPTHIEIICRQKSTALCEAVHTISKECVGEFIKTCTAAEMKRIDEALMVSLGIVPDPIRNDENDEQPRKQIKGFCDEEPEKQAPDSLKIERDLYKSLYEQLLDKITG